MVLEKLILRQSRLISISVTRNFARTITSEQNGSGTTTTNTGPEGTPEAGGGGVNNNNLQTQNLSQSSSSTTDPPPPNNHPLEGQKQQQQAFTRSQEYENFKHFQNTTGRLGSIPGRVYRPHIAANHPPGPRDITLELLMASGAHLGHLTSLWNPGNARYIHGIRDNIHIISLETIAAHLRRAARVVEGVARAGGSIVFVGTRRGQERCVINAAKMCGGAHVFDWWIAGTITNAHNLLQKKKVVERDMADRIVSPKPISDGRVVVPDLVVVLNPMENSVALHECALAGVPTVGIVDTDMDPLRVTYPIPCNDDSLRAGGRVGVCAG
ncbi:ribosomal protein S2, flavodoxin-like domain-containing protein [Tuber borchii]|uniref:Ribosomal protein S2, flavodoxin-like domain-containing protein n=1 Tax=Tuber borchii TaxID=42251 RepID=A0A2T6ZNI6_TUBBO|nr:ribosomal protein S2, flavodoxin-like domain-containing protein [Tuber borchii]